MPPHSSFPNPVRMILLVLLPAATASNRQHKSYDIGCCACYFAHHYRLSFRRNDQRLEGAVQQLTKALRGRIACIHFLRVKKFKALGLSCSGGRWQWHTHASAVPFRRRSGSAWRARRRPRKRARPQPPGPPRQGPPSALLFETGKSLREGRFLRRSPQRFRQSRRPRRKQKRPGRRRRRPGSKANGSLCWRSGSKRPRLRGWRPSLRRQGSKGRSWTEGATSTEGWSLRTTGNGRCWSFGRRSVRDSP